MNTTIKTTHIELTPLVRAQIDHVNTRLTRLTRSLNQKTLASTIEIGQVTKHRSGNIFRAEINLSSAHTSFRATAQDITLSAALKTVGDEIRNQLSHHKGKERNAIRRKGAVMKNRER